MKPQAYRTRPLAHGRVRGIYIEEPRSRFALNDWQFWMVLGLVTVTGSGAAWCALAVLRALGER